MQKKISGQQVDVALGDLNDVDVTGVSDGDVILRQAGSWVAAPAPGGGTALPDVFELEYAYVEDGLDGIPDTSGLFSAVGTFMSLGQFDTFELGANDANGFNIDALVSDAAQRSLRLQVEMQTADASKSALLLISKPEPILSQSTGHRGFIAGVMQTYGAGDTAVVRLVISANDTTPDYAIDGDTNTDDLTATNISSTAPVAVIAFSTEADTMVPASALQAMFEAFVDNVLYNGVNLATAAQAKAGFYANIAAIQAPLPALYPDFEFFDDHPTNTVWPYNSINDGGYDQYDGGNYINTNLETEIPYGAGDVVTGAQADSAFGVGASYVSMYSNAFFALVATGVSINSIYLSGDMGADGDGVETVTSLAPVLGWKFNEISAVRDVGVLQAAEAYRMRLSVAGLNLRYMSLIDDVDNDANIITSTAQYDMYLLGKDERSVIITTGLNGSIQITGNSGAYVNATEYSGSSIDIRAGNGVSDYGNQITTEGASVTIKPGSGGTIGSLIITNISQASPAVVTVVAHSRPVGEYFNCQVQGINGMPEIVGQLLMGLVVDSTTVNLYTQGTFTPLNTSAYTPYVSGGQLNTSKNSGKLELLADSNDFSIMNGIFINNIRWPGLPPAAGSADYNRNEGLAPIITSQQGSRRNLSWLPPVIAPLKKIVELPASQFDLGRAVQHDVMFRFSGTGTSTIEIRPENMFVSYGATWHDPNLHGSTASGDFAAAPIGAMMTFANWSTTSGVIAFSWQPPAGVVVNWPTGKLLTMSAKGAYAYLIKVAANTWDLYGDLDNV